MIGEWRRVVTGPIITCCATDTVVVVKCCCEINGPTHGETNLAKIFISKTPWLWCDKGSCLSGLGLCMLCFFFLR
jgi:hypothetical protein